MPAAQLHQGRTRSSSRDASPGRGAAARPAPELQPDHALVLGLQRRAGNAAVTSILQRTVGTTLGGGRGAPGSSSRIAIAGTEGVSPFRALEALHAQAHGNVVAMGTHEWKVERYTRFLEGDDEHLRTWRSKLPDAHAEKAELAASAATKKAPKEVQALQKAKVANAKRIAAATAAFGAEPGIATDPKAAADSAVDAADGRLTFALEAQSRTAAERPVVGYAYDETTKLLASAGVDVPATTPAPAGEGRI